MHGHQVTAGEYGGRAEDGFCAWLDIDASLPISPYLPVPVPQTPGSVHASPCGSDLAQRLPSGVRNEACDIDQRDY